jgi:hypothetical protein
MILEIIKQDNNGQIPISVIRKELTIGTKQFQHSWMLKESTI